MPASGASRPYHHGDLPGALRRAAWDITAESGAWAVSLRECARRAGASHAAPAHHFGSLAGLLAGVAADGYEKMLEYIDASMKDTADRVLACGMGYIRFAMAYPEHFRLMVGFKLIAGEATPTSSELERLRENRRTALERLRGSLREAWVARNRTEPLPNVLDERTALAWSSAHGYASLAIDHVQESLRLPAMETCFAPLIPALLAP